MKTLEFNNKKSFGFIEYYNAADNGKVVMITAYSFETTEEIPEAVILRFFKRITGADNIYIAQGANVWDELTN